MKYFNVHLQIWAKKNDKGILNLENYKKAKVAYEELLAKTTDEPLFAEAEKLFNELFSNNERIIQFDTNWNDFKR
jgi:hypothetical protein